MFYYTLITLLRNKYPVFIDCPQFTSCRKITISEKSDSCILVDAIIYSLNQPVLENGLKDRPSPVYHLSHDNG